MVPPTSIPPVMLRLWIEKAYITVGINAVNTMINAPRYLPIIIAFGVIGKVFKISKLPDLYSSANVRMVMVGTRNSNNQGARVKNPPKFAYPKSSKLESGKTNKKSPFNNKKTISAR